MKSWILLTLIIASNTWGANLASVLTPLIFEAPNSVKANTNEPVVELDRINVETLPASGSSICLDIHDITLALKEVISKHYSIKGDLHVALLSDWNSLPVEEPDWSLVLLDTPKILTSKMLVSFSIKSGGQSLGPWRLSIMCEDWQEALFVKDRSVSRSALINDNFVIRPVDILQHNQQGIVPPSTNLSDYKLVQSLSVSRPLLFNDITQKPMIEKGKVVNVIATNGLLTVSTKAEALNKGNEGDWVALRNIQTRKEFQGKIRNQDTVEVYF